jgi:tRNA threonylcarbamoyl adenosine modification protein YeaZ
MYCLFLDIAFGEGVFALFEDGKAIEYRKCPLEVSRQPTFIFDAFLKKQGRTLDDIAFIACGVGPGSYTGIRSANAIARGISFCTQKKVVAIPSLLLLAPEQKGSYLLVANAGVGGVYSQKIQHDGTTCHYEDPALLSMEMVKNSPEQKVASSSDWLEKEGIAPLIVQSHVNIVAPLAYELYAQGKVHDAFSVPLVYLKPVYIHKKNLLEKK